MPMRRLVLALTLFLSACATAPQQQPAPQQASTIVQSTSQTRGLIGLTANELVGYFGHPSLQVREGTSLKLQFRGRQCVLDAFLYPQGGGVLRVTYINTRLLSGADTDQAACISDLETPS
jgi:hypothetical protein